MLTLSHYLVLGAILFSISVVGIFLNRKNIIIAGSEHEFCRFLAFSWRL
jgi:NADH:ubiquinone oxidoreductase subunit K